MDNYVCSSDVLVDHLVIKDFLLVVVLVVVSSLQKDVLYLLASLSLTAVQVVQSTLNEQLVQVHLEGCSL